MSNAKHTPGPWGVEYGLSSDPATYTPGIDSPGQDFTVILYGIKAKGEACGIHGRTLEEQEANARLIAAAPELLDALASMVRMHEEGATLVGLVGPTIEAARAAIAKATQEQPK